MGPPYLAAVTSARSANIVLRLTGKLHCVELADAISPRNSAGTVAKPGWPCAASRRADALLSQEHVQLCGVLLDVTQDVQQQLPERHLAPGEAADLAGLLGGQGFDRFPASLAQIFR